MGTEGTKCGVSELRHQHNTANMQQDINNNNSTRPREHDTDQGSSEETPRKMPRQSGQSGQCTATRSKCVALDLDETAGSWGLGSLAYQVWIALGQRPEPLVRPFVDHYMAAGGARPYLRELLGELQEWQRQGRIDKVAIFTSASNLNGWVDFLKRCMEEYAQTPELFGQCLCREHAVQHARTTGGLRTIKDLSLLSSDASQVALLDDKPRYAVNGYVIGVPEYDQSVNAADLIQWMKARLPEHAEQIDATFEKDSFNHAPKPIDYSGDAALNGCIQVLMQLFPEPEEKQEAQETQEVTPGCVS